MIGAGIALNLLFHIPLLVGCALTALDVLVVLALQGKGFRYVEALVITLIGSMMVIFAIEMVYAHPDWLAALKGFVPGAADRPQPRRCCTSRWAFWARR